jgi:uncharacterized OsmC-like protein
MAALDEYLDRKQKAIAARQAEWQSQPEAGVVRLSARSRLAGNTGVRPTQMGQHTLVSDSAPGMAGHALGPTAPEMLLGALASCLVHTYVIQACLMNIPLDQIEVEISAALDMVTVISLDDTKPPALEDIVYVAHVTSPADDGVIQAMHDAVERNCPVLNTLRSPAQVRRSRSDSA